MQPPEYYRGLPASTPEQRAAIDALYEVRARLDAEHKRVVEAWRSGDKARWVQGTFAL